MKVEEFVTNGAAAMKTALTLIEVKAQGQKEEMKAFLETADHTEVVKGLAFCLRALFETGEDLMDFDVILDQMREDTEQKPPHMRAHRYTALSLLQATKGTLTAFTIALYSAQDTDSIIDYMVDVFRHYTSVWTGMIPDQSSLLYCASLQNAIELDLADRQVKENTEQEFLDTMKDSSDATARGFKLLRIALLCFTFDNRTCLLTDPAPLETAEVADLIGTDRDKAVEMLRILCTLICFITSKYLYDDTSSLQGFLDASRKGADIMSIDEALDTIDLGEYVSEDEPEEASDEPADELEMEVAQLLPSEVQLTMVSLLEAVAMDDTLDFYLQVDTFPYIGSLLFTVIAALVSIIHFDVAEEDPELFLDRITLLISGE